MRRLSWILLLSLVGCGSDPKTAADADNRCGPGDDVERAAVTAGEGAKTGGETAVAGVKQVGKSIGGFVEGGSEGAEEGWNEGKAETKQAARKGAGDTRTAANTRPCNP